MRCKNNAVEPSVAPCLPGLVARMQQSARAAIELTNEGFNVFAIDVFKDKMPTLQIMPSALCLEKIRREEATYYKHSPGQRWGQFTRHDCRVIWVERFN